MNLIFLMVYGSWTFCQAWHSEDRIYFETDFQKEQPQEQFQQSNSTMSNKQMQPAAPSQNPIGSYQQMQPTAPSQNPVGSYQQMQPTAPSQNPVGSYQQMQPAVPSRNPAEQFQQMQPAGSSQMNSPGSFQQSQTNLQQHQFPAPVDQSLGPGFIESNSPYPSYSTGEVASRKPPTNYTPELLSIPASFSSPVASTNRTQSLLFVPDPTTLKFSGAINDMALRLEGILGTGTDVLVFSPLSLAGALGLILLGASGRARNEIGELLHLDVGMNYSPDGMDRAQTELTSYFKRYEDSSASTTTHFSSGVFVQKDFQISPAYANSLRKLYVSEIQLVDFKYNQQSTMNNINSWVANRTQNHITQLLRSPLPSDTAAVFLNVIYFEGEWETHFSELATRRKNFRVSPTESVEVDLMTNIGDAYFLEDKINGFKVLGLPYKNPDLSMFFILPYNGPKDFLKGRNAYDLVSIISKCKFLQTIYAVPKMKLESTLELNEPLKRMGVKSMFTPSPDLRGIAEGIWVHSVIQKVEVDVTETGTKAAAATMISSTRHGRPVVRLDQPFIFMVYHHRYRSIIFWGTVYKPTPFY